MKGEFETHLALLYSAWGVYITLSHIEKMRRPLYSATPSYTPVLYVEKREKDGSVLHSKSVVKSEKRRKEPTWKEKYSYTVNNKRPRSSCLCKGNKLKKKKKSRFVSNVCTAQTVCRSVAWRL